MKRSRSVMIAWLLLAAALWFVLSKRHPQSISGPVESETSRIQTPKDRISPVPMEGSSRRAAASPVLTESRRDEVFQEIQSAVITYAPEGVKPIAGHLLDSDPELREAARQGLVQLGESAAIPLLREAARRLDEAEAKACLEAASFLELPSWSETEEARAISAELSKPSLDP